jgi:hypothetical protein
MGPPPAPGSMPPPPPPGPPGAPNPFAPPPPAPPPGYPQWGPPGQYPGPYPPSGPWGQKSTNGFAIAALVLGIAGWIVCGVGSILAIIFGFIAQGQIRQSEGRQGGEGMAKAGIILGFIGVALIAVYFIVAVAVSASNST